MRISNLGFLILFFCTEWLYSEPRLSSWFTDYSGNYARIYETLSDEGNLSTVTTWSRGAGVQSIPTYAGIHEISYTDAWIYIRTTNLASHIMGPWYLNQAKTNLHTRPDPNAKDVALSTSLKNLAVAGAR